MSYRSITAVGGRYFPSPRAAQEMSPYVYRYVGLRGELYPPFSCCRSRGFDLGGSAACRSIALHVWIWPRASDRRLCIVVLVLRKTTCHLRIQEGRCGCTVHSTVHDMTRQEKAVSDIVVRGKKMRRRRNNIPRENDRASFRQTTDVICFGARLALYSTVSFHQRTRYAAEHQRGRKLLQPGSTILVGQHAAARPSTYLLCTVRCRESKLTMLPF